MAISINRVQIQQVLAALRQQSTSCLLGEVARLCPELTMIKSFWRSTTLAEVVRCA